MLQRELTQQKESDVYNAYRLAIASMGEDARYVSKSALVDKAMSYPAPRFYVTFERAARIIARIRKGILPDRMTTLKMEMYRDLYGLFLQKTDGRISSLRNMLEMEAPSFYIDKPHFNRIIRNKLKGGGR